MFFLMSISARLSGRGRRRHARRRLSVSWLQPQMRTLPRDGSFDYERSAGAGRGPLRQRLRRVSSRRLATALSTGTSATRGEARSSRIINKLEAVDERAAAALLRHCGLPFSFLSFFSFTSVRGAKR